MENNRIERIIIDDNEKEYEVVNKLGKKLGILRFNPTDTGILIRLEKVQDKLDETIKEITEKAFDAATLEKASECIRETFDYVFAGNIYDTFFEITNPFAFCGGKFYFEMVIDVISPILERNMKKSITASQLRAEEYMNNIPENRSARRRRNKNKRKKNNSPVPVTNDKEAVPEEKA